MLPKVNENVVLGGAAVGIIMSLIFGWAVDGIVELVMAGSIYMLVRERNTPKG